MYTDTLADIGLFLAGVGYLSELVKGPRPYDIGEVGRAGGEVSRYIDKIFKHSPTVHLIGGPDVIHALKLLEKKIDADLGTDIETFMRWSEEDTVSALSTLQSAMRAEVQPASVGASGSRAL